MTKLIAIGDLHLSARIGGRDYFDDVREAMNAIPRDVTAIQLGDVCDPDHGPRTFRALQFYAEWMRQRSASTTTLVGNHDCIDDARAWSSLSMFDGVIASVRTVPMQRGLVALFMPWMSAAHFSDGQTPAGLLDQIARITLDAMPKGDRAIVFCHLDLPGIDYGGERDMPRLGALDLPAWLLDDPRVELVVAGHIHKAQTRGKLVVVGSLVSLGFEPGGSDGKGYLALDI